MVSHALDIISFGGALAASAAVIKSLKLLKNSSNSYAELLKGLSRPKRRRLTEEIIRVNNPRVPNRLLKK